VKIYQSRSFEQKVKKMPKQEKEVLDQEIRIIAENPSIGEEKKGRPQKGYLSINSNLKRTNTFLLIERLVTTWSWL